jgi:transposase
MVDVVVDVDVFLGRFLRCLETTTTFHSDVIAAVNLLVTNINN